MQERPLQVKISKRICWVACVKGVFDQSVRASPERQQPIENRLKCVIQARSELFSA